MFGPNTVFTAPDYKKTQLIFMLLENAWAASPAGVKQHMSLGFARLMSTSTISGASPLFGK